MKIHQNVKRNCLSATFSYVSSTFYDFILNSEDKLLLTINVLTIVNKLKSRIRTCLEERLVGEGRPNEH